MLLTKLALLGTLLVIGTPPVQDAQAHGEQLLEREEYAAAETALREAIAADPGSASAHGSLALALLYQGKTDEAIEEGYLAVSSDPDSSEARMIYGRTLATAGRPLEAARELEKVVAAKPDDPSPLNALAQVYTAAQDDRALAAYERLVQLKPDVPRYVLRLAEYLWATGRPERGNRVAEDALSTFPDEFRIHALYGRALVAQDRVVDAVRELTRARDAGMTDLATLELLCSTLWVLGDADATEAAFRATLEQHPQAAALYAQFGRFLLSVGRPEPALTALGEAVRQQPRDAMGHLDHGRAFEAAGKIAEAEQAYRRALELRPQLSSAHYSLGRLLMLHGDREEGQRELALYREGYDTLIQREQGLRARAGEIDLARVELRHGDAEAALARFAALPESTATLIGQASALSRLRRHGEAIAVLERAQELEPRNPKIWVQLASERIRAEEITNEKAEESP